LAHIEDPTLIWDRSHNEILDSIVMRGWLGLLAVVLLALAVARRGYRLWPQAPDLVSRAWAAAPLAALLAHAVEVQFAFSTSTTPCPERSRRKSRDLAPAETLRLRFAPLR